ncbi:5-hydroxytryptamine receptor 1D-like [Diadema setosum]|uniref:5-hydroxytryptamine receptor 1D-like n=1 Tax=Diadema setosum TaxID=31175 RepID=UPI003B3AFCB1
MGLVNDMHNATNFLIVNQSLIDLLTSLLLVAYQITPASPPNGGLGLKAVFCAFWVSKYPFWSLIMASGANLVVITCERFYAISYPLRFHTLVRFKHVATLAAVPWMYALIFNIYIIAWSGVEGVGNYEGLAYEITVLMAFGNMWINPVIYAFRYKKFQKAFRRLFIKGSPQKVPSVYTNNAGASVNSGFIQT